MMGNQEELDFEHVHARVDDPNTSKTSARIAGLSARSNKYKILQVLDLVIDGTFESIANIAGISEGNSWKRLSDLKREFRVSVVREDGITKQNASCSVYRITMQGRMALASAKGKSV